MNGLPTSRRPSGIIERVGERFGRLGSVLREVEERADSIWIKVNGAEPAAEGGDRARVPPTDSLEGVINYGFEEVFPVVERINKKLSLVQEAL